MFAAPVNTKKRLLVTIFELLPPVDYLMHCKDWLLQSNFPYKSISGGARMELNRVHIRTFVPAHHLQISTSTVCAHKT